MKLDKRQLKTKICINHKNPTQNIALPTILCLL